MLEDLSHIDTDNVPSSSSLDRVLDDEVVGLIDLLEKIGEGDSKVIAVFDLEIKMDRERVLFEGLDFHIDEAACEPE